MAVTKRRREIFALDRSEKDSAVWGRLVEHMLERIEELRDGLEQSDSERNRGAIGELRLLIELGKDRT